MAQAKMVFSYLGPVRVYDDITTNKWGGTTMRHGTIRASISTEPTSTL